MQVAVVVILYLYYNGGYKVGIYVAGIKLSGSPTSKAHLSHVTQQVNSAITDIEIEVPQFLKMSIMQ